ncbi:MAG: hypothetical protein HY722_12280 [Planctomycetes bacterium]|nr:hypothetical protein [Planctomycetota bacterium]
MGQLQTKLAGLRRLLRTLVLADGLARLVLLAVGLAAASFLLDRGLDLPVALRHGLRALLAGALVLGTAAFLARPLARRLSDDALALRLERTFPELEDRVITALEFARSGVSPEFAAPGLVRRVLAEAEERVGGLDLARTVRTRGTAATVLAAAAATTVLGLGAAARTDLARAWFLRVCLAADSPWPRGTVLALVGPSAWDLPDAPIVVIRGEDLTVDVAVLRGNPERVDVHYVMDRTGRAEAASMRRYQGAAEGGLDLFRRVFENVTEGFRFHVEGGDDRTPAHGERRVEVHLRPEVGAIHLELEHPAYTGLPPRSQDGGHVEAVVGTRVRFEARTVKPVVSAALVVGSADPVPVEVADGGDRLAGTFQVRQDGSYFFRLVDAEGIDNPSPVEFVIHAVPDRRPEVWIPRPGKNKQVTATALQRIEVRFEDDFGLGRARLVHRVVPAGAAEAEPGAGAEGAPAQGAGVDLTGEGRGRRRIDAATDLDLAPLGLKVGDRVLYRAEAEDLRSDDAGGPNLGRTREEFSFTIVSPEDLAADLHESLAGVREELRELSRLQKETLEDVEAVRSRAAEGELGREDQRGLVAAGQEERRIAVRLRRSADLVDSVAREKAQNRIGSPAEQEWLAGLRDDLAHLAETAVPAVAERLDEARRSRASAPPLGEAVLGARAVLDRLSQVLARLDKWSDLNDVIQDVHELLEAMERMYQDVKGGLK